MFYVRYQSNLLYGGLVFLNDETPSHLLYILSFSFVVLMNVIFQKNIKGTGLFIKSVLEQ